MIGGGLDRLLATGVETDREETALLDLTDCPGQIGRLRHR